MDPGSAQAWDTRGMPRPRNTPVHVLVALLERFPAAMQRTVKPEGCPGVAS